MFFRYRRRPSLFGLLMFLLGFKFIVKEHLTESERAEYRTKGKAFRRKMREAFAVWDEDENEETASDRA